MRQKPFDGGFETRFVLRLRRQRKARQGEINQAAELGADGVRVIRAEEKMNG